MKYRLCGESDVIKSVSILRQNYAYKAQYRFRLINKFVCVVVCVVMKSDFNSIEMRKFVAGGIAGCCAKGAVSPLDRIKIMRQGKIQLKRL